MPTPRESTSSFFRGRIERSDGCGSWSVKGRIRQNHPRSEGCLAAREPMRRRLPIAYDQNITSVKGLGGVSVEERGTFVERNGVPSAMYCNLGSGRNVVQRHGTPDETRAMFWQ